jgi:hypothetical protein
MATITLLDGGTTATTGGSNQVFAPVGKNVVNGTAYGDSAVSDIMAREEVVLSSRAAAVTQTGAWSKQKSKATLVVPHYDTDTGMHYSLIRIEMEVSPVHLAAESTLIDTLREKGAQLIIDSELDDFWNAGARP